MQFDGHMRGLIDRVMKAPTAAYAKLMSDRISKLMDEGKFDVDVSMESSESDAVDETKIGTEKEFAVVTDNLKVGMRQLPLKMAQEGVLMLRQTNMSGSMKTALAEHMTMKGTEFRRNFDLQNSLVDDMAPRMAAMINQRNIWHEMKKSASSLGKYTKPDEWNPPEASAMVDPLPALGRLGMASLRRANLTVNEKLRANVRGGKARNIFCDAEVPGASDVTKFGAQLQFLTEQGLDLAPTNWGWGGWIAFGLGGHLVELPGAYEVALILGINGLTKDQWKLQVHMEIADRVCPFDGDTGGYSMIFMVQYKDKPVSTASTTGAVKFQYSQFNGVGFQYVEGPVVGGDGEPTGNKGVDARLFFPFQVPIAGLGSEWWAAIRFFLGFKYMPALPKIAVSSTYQIEPEVSCCAGVQYRVHIAF